MPKVILTDTEIVLTIYGSQKGYPEHLRLIRFYDEEHCREFIFLTNAMELTAQQIADLYKNRWQIELFFKCPTSPAILYLWRRADIRCAVPWPWPIRP